MGPSGEADTRRVLYLTQKSLRGDFKLELWLAQLDGTGPRKVDEGVYGYELSPDGKDLYWKARCSMGSRSCTLFRAPIDGSAQPRELSKNVAGFDLSRDGGRILLAAPHRGSSRSIDLAWLPAAIGPEDKPRPIALDVDPSARFSDTAGRRVVFAGLTPGHAGVYFADLP